MSGFCNIRRIAIHPSELDGMRIHRTTIIPSPHLAFNSPLPGGGERHYDRKVSCPITRHNDFRQRLEPRPLNQESRALTMSQATVLPQSRCSRSPKIHNSTTIYCGCVQTSFLKYDFADEWLILLLLKTIDFSSSCQNPELFFLILARSSPPEVGRECKIWLLLYSNFIRYVILLLCAARN